MLVNLSEERIRVRWVRMSFKLDFCESRWLYQKLFSKKNSIAQGDSGGPLMAPQTLRGKTYYYQIGIGMFSDFILFKVNDL